MGGNVLLVVLGSRHSGVGHVRILNKIQNDVVQLPCGEPGGGKFDESTSKKSMMTGALWRKEDGEVMRGRKRLAMCATLKKGGVARGTSQVFSGYHRTATNQDFSRVRDW